MQDDYTYLSSRARVLFRHLARLAPLSVAGLVYSCTSDIAVPSPPTENFELVKVRGDGQTAEVGSRLPLPVSVRVLDETGVAVPDVVIAFEVTDGGGVIASKASVTGRDGVASTEWTIGATSGDANEVAAILRSTSDTIRFRARGLPGAPAVATVTSGDGQYGAVKTRLGDSVAVSVLDRFGNGVPGVAVSFSVLSGSGSVSPESTVTTASGKASTSWMMGPIAGEAVLQAQVGAVPGQPLRLRAQAIDLQVVGTAEAELVEGLTATVYGSGFSENPEENTVVVDGVEAVVLNAYDNALRFVVPHFDCRPARSVQLLVRVHGFPSQPIETDVRPEFFLNMAPGEHRIYSGGSSPCLQIAASSSPGEYVLGIQSLSRVPSALTPVLLAGVAPDDGKAGSPQSDLMNSQELQRSALNQTRLAESRVQKFNREVIESPPSSASGPLLDSPMAIDGNIEVGDQLPVRVVDLTRQSTSCSDFSEIQTRVRAIGQRGVWLEDITNPSGGFSQNDFLQMSNDFDNDMYNRVTAYFGLPTDIDGNGRIAIVFTREVNRAGGLLGFTVACDMFRRSVGNEGSNEGEVFYAKVPDNAGEVGDPFSREDALRQARRTLAHELTHIIQRSRRLELSLPALAPWVAEGQATLAEEVVGHLIEGRSIRSNLGQQVAFNLDDPTSVDWYGEAFRDVARYFGWVPPNAHVAAAPHECSWFAGNGGACSTNRGEYGVPWLLLRWASDHFGPGLVGGETTIQKALIENGGDPIDRLAQAVGLNPAVMLAKWSTALWTDDRVPVQDGLLELESWNLYDIFNNPAGGDAVPPSMRLTPVETDFSGFAVSPRISAGSTFYLRIRGADNSGLSVRARSSGDGALPSQVQLWVLRVQ